MQRYGKTTPQENSTLTGTSAINATGNSANNVLSGNSAGNTLTGGAGNDTLNGGTGNDTMVGGTGDDVYIIYVSTDVITESANEGVDTVQSAITFSLASLANVENITLLGASAVNTTGSIQRIKTQKEPSDGYNISASIKSTQRRHPHNPKTKSSPHLPPKNKNPKKIFKNPTNRTSHDWNFHPFRNISMDCHINIF